MRIMLEYVLERAIDKKATSTGLEMIDPHLIIRPVSQCFPFMGENKLALEAAGTLVERIGTVTERRGRRSRRRIKGEAVAGNDVSAFAEDVASRSTFERTRRIVVKPAATLDVRWVAGAEEPAQRLIGD